MSPVELRLELILIKFQFVWHFYWLIIFIVSFKRRRDYFKEKGIELVGLPENLVDLVWGEQKPDMPQEKAFILDTKYTGRTVQEKFNLVSQKLNKTVDVLLVPALDDIAWLLNLRGNDIEYNPVFFAYVLFYASRDDDSKPCAHLFINKNKVSDEDVVKHLKDNNVEVFDYNDIEDNLKKLVSENKKVALDENECNYRLFEILEEAKPEIKEGVVEHLKAKKSKAEMEGMKNCNVRDCAAIVKYFAWLEHKLKSNPDSGLTEYDGARKVEEFRTEGELYKGPSFDTISSIGPNGAVIHYKPQ
jgi:Xaa-Pro aminopeptidase